MRIRCVYGLAFIFILTISAYSQDSSTAAGGQNPAQWPGGGGQGRRGSWAGGMGEGRGVMGAVTEAGADHFTVKTEMGETYTVHFSVNTRFVKAPERRRGQGQADGGGSPPEAIKPTDIKVGDEITAGGEVDQAAKSIGAVFIALLSPEQVKRMQEMEAKFGKTWLAGKVTAVDGVKVTVQGGPGNALHSFVADENTTFRKRREPITLGDVQVGDSMRVEGALKDGVFVASAVVVMGMQSQPQEPQPK